MNIEKNWSFKLLLETERERSDEMGKPANMSMPFLADVNASNTKNMHGLYPPDTEHEVNSVKPSNTIEIEESLSLNDLDELSVSELQKLRRSIALRLHPDRPQGTRIVGANIELSEVNQRIDEAIKGKSSLGI